MKKAIFLFAALLVANATVHAQTTASTAPVAAGYAVGDKVQDFKLKNVDGRDVSMSLFPDAKGFIVVFTCNHCPYSVAYEDRIEALNKKYNSKGYMVIAINPNDPAIAPGDSYDAMKERAKEKNFSFPYLYDEGQSVMKNFGAQRTPHVFVVSNNGNENYKVEYIGAIDDNYEDATAVKKRYVEDAVDALLNGKKPETTFTKAIGCSVKVKKA
jgi:peroxiredoxin